MRALLDTHTFLWWITGSERLSPRVREIIREGDTLLFLSAASVWEIMIKAQSGKLQLPDDPARFIDTQLTLNAIEAISIQVRHALHLSTLPTYHRDPFDRILIAQSQLEGLPILTADPLIARYARLRLSGKVAHYG